MKNKLCAIWHILLGDAVMYRITASRHDKIVFGNSSNVRWWRRLLPPAHDSAAIECRTWEDMHARWLRLIYDEQTQRWIDPLEKEVSPTL